MEGSELQRTLLHIQLSFTRDINMDEVDTIQVSK